MRVAVCDDDDRTRAKYSLLIKAIAEKRGIVLQISEYETGKQLQFALSGPDEPPDIILMDILMPGPNGIEVGKQLRNTGFQGIIIYLSQSPDYMQSAFDVSAFNYLVKAGDVEDEEQLERVFMKAVKKTQLRKRKYILLNGISEHRNLAIDSILYFESLKHVVTVHYDAGESFEFISSLSRVEDALGAYGFIRTHRSYLVNCAMIQRFDFKDIELTDGTVLPVGRKHYSKLKSTVRENAVVSLGPEK